MEGGSVSGQRWWVRRRRRVAIGISQATTPRGPTQPRHIPRVSFAPLRNDLPLRLELPTLPRAWTGLAEDHLQALRTSESRNVARAANPWISTFEVDPGSRCSGRGYARHRRTWLTRAPPGHRGRQNPVRPTSLVGEIKLHQRWPRKRPALRVRMARPNGVMWGRQRALCACAVHLPSALKASTREMSGIWADGRRKGAELPL